MRILCVRIGFFYLSSEVSSASYGLKSSTFLLLVYFENRYLRNLVKIMNRKILVLKIIIKKSQNLRLSTNENKNGTCIERCSNQFSSSFFSKFKLFLSFQYSVSCKNQDEENNSSHLTDSCRKQGLNRQKKQIPCFFSIHTLLCLFAFIMI